MPGPHGPIAAAGFKVAGQGLGGSHGPDARSRSRCAADHGAVASRKQVVVAFHLQEAIGKHPALWIHRQSAGREPLRGATAAAAQAGNVGVPCLVFSQFHLSVGEDLTFQRAQLLGAALQLQGTLGPAAAQGQHHFQSG